MPDFVIFDKQKRNRQLQVTDTGPHTILSLSIDKERLKKQLLYHHVFRLLKPTRKKYNLSGNDILVLNGIYIYTLCIRADFTITSIINFVKYYNSNRMTFYFNKLIERGYIRLNRTTGSHTYYRITSEGLNVINDLFNEYDSIHAKFINQFNISL